MKANAKLPLIAGSGAAVVLVALLPVWGGAGGEDLPTAEVARADFVQRVSAEGNLRAVRATAISVPGTVGGPVRVAWLLPDGSRVEAGDPVVRFDATDMEKQLADARDDLATNRLKTTKERTQSAAQLANLELDTKLAADELEDARRFVKKDAEIYSRHEILESEIDEHLAAEKKRASEAAQKTQTSLSRTELDLLAIDRRRVEAKIDQARQGLDSLEVTAPHAGIVVLERNWRGETPRVGDTAFPGMTLAHLPDLGEMEAEVFVLEADAGGLASGKPAQVTLEAHPEIVVRAEIANVDKLAKPRFRGSPVQYFAVVLKLDHTDSKLMKPGQRVRAELLLSELHDALTVPRQAVFEDAGKPIVYRSTESGFVPVPVTLGPSARGRVVVAEGLAAGDRVALRDPTRSAQGRAEGDEKRAAATPGTGG